MGRESNPREVREANARFEYELRNRGAAYAIDAMHKRNAERREADKKEAFRRTAEILHKGAEEELRKMKRTSFSQLTD